MNDLKHDPLLKELLSGEDAAQCRAASLEQMLGSVRQRQRQRQARRVAAMAAVPVLIVLALVITRPPTPVSQQAGRTSLPPSGATASLAHADAAAATEASVRFISDDELLSLFPGRPVALIGPPGRQQFVFLDQKRSFRTLSDGSSVKLVNSRQRVD